MVHPTQRTAALAAAFFLVGSLFFGLHAVSAQTTVAHPVHIHKGSCAALGDVAYPLQDVEVTAPAAGTPTTAGAATALPVWTSVTTLDVKLTALLAQPYAINVHKSASAIENYIACGDIGGQVVANELTIGLHLLGTYGYAGIAVLHADGDKTKVTLHYVEPLSSATSANTVGITETEMMITASQTSFKVGQTYTFVATNVGTTEHELVIEHRGDVDKPLEQNGQEAEAPDIEPGKTKTLTWTFTEPGEYEFACHLPAHFEAGMVLPIEVTT